MTTQRAKELAEKNNIYFGSKKVPGRFLLERFIANNGEKHLKASDVPSTVDTAFGEIPESHVKIEELYQIV